MNSNNVNEQKRQEDREEADAEYITQHLNGNYAQQDSSIGDTHLNRYSAPAALTTHSQPYKDYKYVSRRVHIWDGKTVRNQDCRGEEAAEDGADPWLFCELRLVVVVFNRAGK